MTDAVRNPDPERNKAVALRFKKSQGTREMPQVEKEVLAPDYNRIRGGNFHLASNARGEGWPGPGMYLRAAFPDRVDIIEHLVAEGDQAWMRFYIYGTHQASFCGLPATGKRVGVPAVDVSRFAGGKWKESWCFGDELGLLLQLGAPDLLFE